MKNRPITTILALAIFAALATACLTGCQALKDHVTIGGGASLGTNGLPTGTITIGFKSLDGQDKVVTYTAPSKSAAARGWDEAGQWHSLNEALELAKAAMLGGRSAGDRARLLKWGTWDTDNAVGIEALLRYHQANPREIK
jgi:hypothetical protein